MNLIGSEDGNCQLGQKQEIKNHPKIGRLLLVIKEKKD